MESRHYHRRLVPLGIHGNLPAIAAYCQTTEEEQGKILEALLQQKMGAASKTFKKVQEYKDQRQQQAPDEKIPLKIAKIGQGAVIKWARNHRSMREGEQELIDNETEDTPKPQYTSRKLACTRCGHQQETSWMQLRCREGSRAVHYRNCGKQERSARNYCRCGTIWHQCPKH